MSFSQALGSRCVHACRRAAQGQTVEANIGRPYTIPTAQRSVLPVWRGRDSAVGRSGSAFSSPGHASTISRGLFSSRQRCSSQSLDQILFAAMELIHNRPTPCGPFGLSRSTTLASARLPRSKRRRNFHFKFFILQFSFSQPPLRFLLHTEKSSCSSATRRGSLGPKNCAAAL